MGDIIHAFGLRGPNLAAFRAASAIIARNMAALDSEDVLRAMRRHLAAAGQEPTYERGEAQCAIAANKLAISMGLI